MRNILLGLCILISYFGYSQSNNTDGYIYGEMHGDGATLIGYFKFDKYFSKNGQTVRYRKDLQSKVSKKLSSRRYQYFTSDSLYMKTFGVMPYGLGGDLLVMVPRIIDGPIELFYFPYTRPTTILTPRYEPYHIRSINFEKWVSKKRFKEEMRQIIGANTTLYKYIEDDTLVYDDLPIIEQLANRNADEAIIQQALEEKQTVKNNICPSFSFNTWVKSK